MSWAVIVSAVGVGMSAVSSYQQAQSARAQAQYQQQVAYNNSIIAQQNAADVRDRGDRDAEEHRDRIAQSKGAAKGDMASLGFLIDDPESTNVGLLLLKIRVLRRREHCFLEQHPFINLVKGRIGSK